MNEKVQAQIGDVLSVAQLTLLHEILTNPQIMFPADRGHAANDLLEKVQASLRAMGKKV